MKQNLEFIHLNSAEEMLVTFPLIRQMYEKIDKETYFSHIKEMIARNDFKMIAVFEGARLVAACGYWIFLMLYCDRYMQISSLVVDEDKRSQGIGKKLMKHLEEIAKKEGCKKFVLDSYTENKRSHNLYFSQGFYIRGFHFMKDL